MIASWTLRGNPLNIKKFQLQRVWFRIALLAALAARGRCDRRCPQPMWQSLGVHCPLVVCPLRKRSPETSHKK
ncbi:hypothetical protein AK812_SmicGene45403, partial [Symbiodinium microadriaticum]